MKVDGPGGRRSPCIGKGSGGCRGPQRGTGAESIGVQGANPEWKWISLIDIDKNCFSSEKFSLTSLKEHKGINCRCTLCFLITPSRLLGLTVIYFGKNMWSQFSSFINQFIFMFAKNCQELIRMDRGCTALSTATSVCVDQICIIQEWHFNRIVKQK